MTCYAPGPWRRTGRVIESVDHAKWYTVAWVADDAFTPEAIAANAALIAAAPELHQALAEVLGDYRNDLAVIRPRTLKLIVSALAKVEGGAA